MVLVFLLMFQIITIQVSIDLFRLFFHPEKMCFSQNSCYSLLSIGMFKRNGMGDVITSTADEGGEDYYYNDAIPWEGASIKYIQEIVQVS